MSLSDALNPYLNQNRPRPSFSVHSEVPQPAFQPSQQYVPHRSELELAISPPTPPPQTRVRAQPSANGIHAVHELLRVVSATRETQEIERKRRLAWEQEQEAKFVQRQAEMERQMFELRQEINTLRASINSNPPGLIIPCFSGSSATSQQQLTQPASPLSPVSQPQSHSRPSFVEGSSRQSNSDQQPFYHQPSDNLQPRMQIVEQSSVTPSPSPPQLTFVEPSLLQTETSTRTSNRRKRPTSDMSSAESENSSDSDSSSSRPRRQLKRTNHHDKRCLTIHHAMRAHILRLMNLESDKSLPDSHTEGVALQLHEPVRFLWDKTTKQSVHNARMKARILADIKSNRRLYKYVPDKDFGKKSLDSVFDQSFTTLRQKFKAQRDALTALSIKKREDQKALKARRLARRKFKLNYRAEARMKVEVFEHITFDGALQVECMSSEESDFEDGSASRPSGLLRTRGYLWRSSRLLKFYSKLDDEEVADRAARQKRGVGKKERFTGPPKDGFHLPPKGIATWMVSRRWLKTAQRTHPDLPDALKNIIVDPPGFDWKQFDALGEESEDSDNELHTMDDLESNLQHYSSSTSSLHFALA